jgi:hypothetical protein
MAETKSTPIRPARPAGTTAGATHADITGLKADIAAVRADLREIELRIVARLGTAAAVIAGLMLTALHIWPPHP